MSESFPFHAQDRDLVEVAKSVKILSNLSWPAELREPFLESWRRGDPQIPSPPPVAPLPPEGRAVLEGLADWNDDHPAARFLQRTAQSYVDAWRLLEASGGPDFTEASIRLFGSSRDRIVPGGPTNLEAAEAILRDTAALAESCFVSDADVCLTPQHVARQLDAAFAAVFGEGELVTVLEPTLSSKAAANAERVRIRSGTCFSPADVAQLIHHEGFVHALTLKNGRRQPRLTALGLGAPRTTCAQEGLATFAEFITTSIDLSRLRRLALRVKGIDLALSGADFVELFRFFLDQGQSEIESFHSSARIFRGGDPRGDGVFTKDAVYLRGLLRTHAFLHAALGEHKVEYTHYLFAGRMTWEDVLELAPLFEDGTIDPPRFEPEWVLQRNNLAAYLAFSNLTREVPLDDGLASFLP